MRSFFLTALPHVSDMSLTCLLSGIGEKGWEGGEAGTQDWGDTKYGGSRKTQGGSRAQAQAQVGPEAGAL